MGRVRSIESSALVVVDMQNAFLDPDVGFRYAPAAGEIVEPINALAHEFRSAGAPVVWVQTTSRPERGDWPSLRHLIGDPAMDFRAGVLAPGSHGQALWPGMAARDEDERVLKYRYSAMIEPDGQLERFLDRRGLSTIFVAGTQTNICCESTARDAMMRGYQAHLVADCLAAETPELHQGALASFESGFGQVVVSDELRRAAQLGRQRT